MSARVLVGDCRALLQEMEAGSVQCCVTSPPYFGLRDYGVAGQIGLEPTPDLYVAEMVAVFRDVRRVLADDGTLWLNLGDSYAGSGKGAGDTKTTNRGNHASRGCRVGSVHGESGHTSGVKPPPGYKAKDLLGIPWMVAFALRADGWYLRSDIIWAKPNPMPESVTDRPTKSHEYLFLLTKSPAYFYDAAAIREPLSTDRDASRKFNANGVGGRARSGNKERKPASARGVPVDTNGSSNGAVAGSVPWEDDGSGRNKRSVWTVPVQPFKGSHFATFPPALIEPCILAGSRVGDTILDPFGGAGTTGLVADRLGRNSILCELNPEYAAMARQRIAADAGMFGDVA